MNIHAIIIEQLEWDGRLKSFSLQAQRDLGEMWVAFPNEYQNERTGPFHFLDSEYENLFEHRKAKCRNAKLASDKFYEKDNQFYISTTWNEIPTKRHQLTFYALYLPEYAIPDKIEISDTYLSNKLFNKMVYRDSDKNRFIVYLECKSSAGVFNFKLDAIFHLDRANFSQTQFNDNKTIGFYERPLDEHWRYLLPEEEVNKVFNFFAEQLVINNGEFKQTYKTQMTTQKNNPWISGSFYLFVGVLILTILAVISNNVHWTLLPVIIIGGILIIGIIGALQLKNDDKLNDESFIKLMSETYKKLPLLRQGKSK
ncbi:hypothetical protein [Sphingobacterium siyangense]